MTALRNRITAVLKKYGEPFTVGGTPAKGIFRPLPLEKAKTYLTDAELSAAGRPMWLTYVPFDDPSKVAASISWNSLTLAVKRVVELRVQGTVVGKIIVAAS